jgi:two-component system sensor histidine kinase QseC
VTPDKVQADPVRSHERGAGASSMRRQLLVLLLGAVAIVWIATAVVSYFDARHELDELLDAHLAQSASLLIAQAGHDLEEIDEHAEDVHRYARRVAFQFWRHGKSLELHSKNAPDVRLSAREEGFSDVRVDGRRWRVFSAWDRERRYLVQVGEQAATRDAIVGAMLRGMLLPLAVALPVLAILLWLAIERALRPLRTLGRQVAHRAPDHLGAIDVGSAPAEVAPLVADLNRLFDRVRVSIDNERRFTADAAHELRTPLAAIRAQAQVARGASADTERTHALDGVIAGCDRATHLVDQLLTLARLEPERFHANRQPVELRAIAQDAVRDIAPLGLARSVEVALHDGTSAPVRADARLLGILLRNLLDNAIRYSPVHAVVRVIVGVRDRRPFVTVEDAGPGVPPEARADLGQRFRRFADADTAGTGLGLSIVKRIAELHGADVAFDAAAAGGLAVTVSFPI